MPTSMPSSIAHHPSPSRDSLIVEALPGYEPEIGRLIWMMDANRTLTKEKVENLPAETIDWVAAPETNSIGALLYHIAAIELDWLYAEVREQPFPPEMTALFQEDVRDERGMLAAARGISLEAHLGRLARVRARLLETYRGMSLADFRRVRNLPEYDVTPEWVLYHLLEHEAFHRGEISLLRGLASQMDAAGARDRSFLGMTPVAEKRTENG